MRQVELHAPITPHFDWSDALWLHDWGRPATEEDGLTDEILHNLMDLFQRMELVREFFGKPINIHCAYRPQKYNRAIGGAENSAHMAMGKEAAADFNVLGITCDNARSLILACDKLTAWEMRMERREGSDWIHLDTRIPAPGHNRYFAP